ncbi:YbjN domain-containing protein [Sphingomonas donggukensis]|uniref:YbjN domain-containing protein n=1 Tax=Sphingomonas donggukensis TaxID=2949093 RepID=A0ABY4TVM5_9SPHN|nr:YbjN domain-containing protein [Sphingomonas donggukensis]URW76460.1 YbjN domain-containing protein [Sphingomonas donggukensis]
MRAVIAGMAAMAAAVAQPALAQDKLFDATDPATLTEAMKTAGFKAELKTNDKGEPYINSAANGSPFTIEFYGCEKAKACPSFQFYAWYKKDPLYTLALVNEWNAAKRFLKLRIDTDGDLAMSMDVTSVGKLTQANFADWVDWYQVMDSELDKFLTEKRAAAGKAAPAPAKK